MCFRKQNKDIISSLECKVDFAVPMVKMTCTEVESPNFNLILSLQIIEITSEEFKRLIYDQRYFR